MTSHADIIVENGAVLTMDEDRPRAAAVAVRGNRIQAVGELASVRELRGPSTRVIDAGGGTVLPGFIEAHMHIFNGAASLDRLSLAEVRDLDTLARLLRGRATARPSEAVVFGISAPYDIVGGPLDRHVLDRIIPDRPLALKAYDGHTVWANTPALSAAGLLHGRSLRRGSEIVMGSDGLATGELREPEAFTSILALLPSGGRESLGYTTGRDPDPPVTPQQRAGDRELLAQGLTYCASLGITSIHNMDGNFYQQELLSELGDDGRLCCRVRLPYHQKNDKTVDELRRDAPAMRARSRPDRLTTDFVKIFVDGVLDSTTAFMLDDYCGRPGNRGQPLFTAGAMNEAVIAADALGFQVAVHAIGDSGVRRTLDAFAAARAANGRRDSRHRIEHIEVIDPADIPRFADLGVVASMQPLHAPGPLSYPGDTLMELIGPRRAPYTFAWRTLQDAGALLAFASDWPVSPVDPLLSIQAAVTRQPFRPGLPEQAVNLERALAAYTRNNARVEFAENRKGRLREGYLADLVLLDGDIEMTPPEAIKDRKVRATICDGRVTYEAV
ncbi:MAG: amidohydrolase [Geminicoccaceae bacterium]